MGRNYDATKDALIKSVKDSGVWGFGDAGEIYCVDCYGVAGHVPAVQYDVEKKGKPVTCWQCGKKGRVSISPDGDTHYGAGRAAIAILSREEDATDPTEFPRGVPF